MGLHLHATHAYTLFIILYTTFFSIILETGLSKRCALGVMFLVTCRILWVDTLYCELPLYVSSFCVYQLVPEIRDSCGG